MVYKSQVIKRRQFFVEYFKNCLRIITRLPYTTHNMLIMHKK